jgi:hypothetical protein
MIGKENLACQAPVNGRQRAHYLKPIRGLALLVYRRIDVNVYRKSTDDVTTTA